MRGTPPREAQGRREEFLDGLVGLHIGDFTAEEWCKIFRRIAELADRNDGLPHYARRAEAEFLESKNT